MSTIAALLVALAPALQGQGQDALLLQDGRLVDQLKIARAEGGFNLSFQNGEIFVPEALVKEALLAAEPPSEASAKQRRELQRRLEESRALLAEHRQHQEWRDRYREESRHFQFEHTVPRHVFEGYRDLMEAYFESFCKEWKVKQPKDLGKLKVCFYAEEELFHQVSGASPGVLGYFRFVDPMELNIYYERLAPAFTEEVMFHEANHYLQKLIRTDFAYPHFPGEAVAEYYGASRFDRATKKLSTGLILDGRLTEVLNDIAAGEIMGLEKLVSTDGLYEHYTWGWSLVHFLMNQERHAERFRKFVRGLAHDPEVKRVHMGIAGLETVEGAEVWRVFRDYLGLKGAAEVQELENEWHSYVEHGLKLETASGLEAAAFAAAHTDRPLRAKRLFEEAIAAGCRNPMAFHGYAELLYDDQRYEDAIAAWDQAIALDPLGARFYAAKGEALIRRKRKEMVEEGRRLIRLAAELDPDDARIRSLLREHGKGK